ncbi:MAG: insulinase family protein [Curvibacter sp.]|nr:insulinase family protein [Curvibacter sp.]
MKRTQTLLAALVLAAAPALQAQTASAARPPAPQAAQASQVQQFTLANGMTLIVKPDHRAPTIAHMVWVRVGAIDEVDGTSGVAHALEHMMFKGTPSLAPGEFSRRVAALGGRENAFTTLDYTGFYQQIPAARLEDVMKLESDRFAHNQWADDEFSREIEVVKEERRMRTEDNPRSLLYEALNAAAFVASPYHRPVVGWMSDLDAMTPDDVRHFWKTWYTPANAAVVIAGDVTPEQALALARRYYEPIPARELPVRKPRLEPVQQGLRRLDFKAPAEQAYVALAFKAPQLHSLAQPGPEGEDALALTVLAAVLDGYPGARLERGLTQGEHRVADSAGAYSGLVGRGPQLFVLDGVPAAGQTPEAVEAALRAQVQRVAREGVSEAELQRVKTQWVAGQVYKLDSVFNQANELGRQWIQGLPLDAGDVLIQRLRAVTAQQVQAVAARYFGDDQLTVATLRPQPIDPNRPRPVRRAGGPD